jgi:hypothetical protein
MDEKKGKISSKEKWRKETQPCVTSISNVNGCFKNSCSDLSWPNNLTFTNVREITASLYLIHSVMRGAVYILSGWNILYHTELGVVYRWSKGPALLARKLNYLLNFNRSYSLQREYDGANNEMRTTMACEFNSES